MQEKQSSPLPLIAYKKCDFVFGNLEVFGANRQSDRMKQRTKVLCGFADANLADSYP